jgi:NAD(P)-dependent dehydrogenase (short-subunit alcohol dehydrogenase family)
MGAIEATRSLPFTFGGAGAIVTGAASGIGAATARTLMSAGIRTIGVDLREPEPDAVFADLQVCRAVDVRDVDGLSALVDEAQSWGISYLVNCAGVLETTGFSGVTPAAWRRCLDVNLVGAYNVLDAVTPLLRQATSAAVVNITSMEAARVIALSDPDPTPQYAAAKAGLHMLTQSAARALAADGIRVNSISPGFVATPMAAAHGSTETLPASLLGRVPAGRFARPTEIAATVAFLLSDQAAYITGSDVRVDGGFQLT